MIQDTKLLYVAQCRKFSTRSPVQCSTKVSSTCQLPVHLCQDLVYVHVLKLVGGCLPALLNLPVCHCVRQQL